MQIEKINENQLQVILNLDDLKKNNISVHSFMCKSSDSKNLFSSILNFANKKIGFNIKNHEVIIEAFSVTAKSSFVLLITRVPKESKLHICKNKYSSFKISKSLWIKFVDFEDFCMLCSSLENNLNIKSFLYLLNNTYYLHIKVNKIKDYFRVLAIASDFSNYIYGYDFVPSENSEIIIKDCAIETVKKYFV